MQSVATLVSCRRRNRSLLHREAVGHQLSHVAETLSLDAIVLADDLGRPLAHAGDAELSGLLAESAMWTMPDDDSLDEATMARIRVLYPDLENRHFVTRPIALNGEFGTRVIAAGKSFARRIGVDQAALGIERICDDAKGHVFTCVNTSGPRYTGVPKQRRRKSVVRWLLLKF